MDLRDLCRTCGRTINEELDVKLFDKCNYPLITLIEDITDMLLEYDNSLSEYICHNCKSVLDQIEEFRASCLNTHKRLLAARKAEIEKSDEDILDTDIAIEKCDDTVVAENKDIDVEQLAITTSECNSDEFVSGSPTIQTPSENDNDIDEVYRPSKWVRKKSTWVCELCGGVFKRSTYLKLHLLRHTGKKEFECDICKRMHYTQNEMMRHRMLHTKARPFPCRFCDKTFRGSSSKAIHERSHTNERPFACQYCDKAFTSSTSKKEHELVHVNYRKFHCEPCDQWFLRKTHLDMHQRSKQHKSKCASKNLETGGKCSI